MSEHPILFSGPVVRAILDGKKTQTRRCLRLPTNPARSSTCPYGSAGSVLWCREAWRIILVNGRLGEGSQFATVQFRTGFGVLPYRKDWRDFYAGLLESEKHWTTGDIDTVGHWRPSIHMPRLTCRLLLGVVSVRVERLQDITTEDIIAEGVSTTLREHDAECDLREKFAELWDSINGKKPGRAWADNPFVWVIEFKRRKVKP